MIPSFARTPSLSAAIFATLLSACGQTHLYGTARALPAVREAAATASATNSVIVYGPDSGIVARTIRSGFPTALITDRRGDVFIAACGEACGGTGTGTVTEFGPTDTKPRRTLLEDDPVALAIDRSGRLWVANYSSGQILGYAAQDVTPSVTINSVQGISALAFDRNGTLYVANQGQNRVDIFAPQTSSPTASITKGIDSPTALVLVDTTLYVGNCGSSCTGTGAASSVTAYSTTSLRQTRRITAGVKGHLALAYDRGDLFVANSGVGSGSVCVYGESPTPAHVITHGIASPQSLLFDARHNLYVANMNGNAVTVYPPDSGKPQRTLLSGEHQPGPMTMDRTGNLYVGNTGSTQSFRREPTRRTTSP